MDGVLCSRSSGTRLGVARPRRVYEVGAHDRLHHNRIARSDAIPSAAPLVVLLLLNCLLSIARLSPTLDVWVEQAAEGREE